MVTPRTPRIRRQGCRVAEQAGTLVVVGVEVVVRVAEVVDSVVGEVVTKAVGTERTGLAGRRTGETHRQATDVIRPCPQLPQEWGAVQEEGAEVTAVATEAEGMERVQIFQGTTLTGLRRSYEDSKGEEYLLGLSIKS